MGSEAIPADELSRAKDALVRSLPGDFETTTRTAANLQAVYVYDLGLDYFARFPARVAAVGAQAAQAAARKYLKPDRLVVVAVGDRAKIEPELKKSPLQLGAPVLSVSSASPSFRTIQACLPCALRSIVPKS